jgi:hypothetical protein
MPENMNSPRLLKKVQTQGGATHPPDGDPADGDPPQGGAGALGPYAAARRELANAADGPFPAA